MARTWTLYDTITLVNPYLARANTICSNEAYDTIYFSDWNTIYSYHTSTKTLTDISGSTFAGVNDVVYNIVRFNGNIYAYAAYSQRSTSYYYARLYKWNGGQSWSIVYTPDAGQGWTDDMGTIYINNQYDHYMECIDGSHIVITGYCVPTSSYTGIAWISTDGITFNYTTVESVISDFGNIILGSNIVESGAYNTVLTTDYSAGDDPFSYYSGSNNWTHLDPEAGTYGPVGYAGGYSWYRKYSIGTNQYYLFRSSDWQATPPTVASASGYLTTYVEWRMQTIGANTHMLCKRNAYNAYTIDDTLTMVQDGVMGDSAHHVIGFFRDYNKMYALCMSGSTNEAKIYGASGTITIPTPPVSSGGVAKLHWGVNNIIENDVIVV